VIKLSEAQYNEIQNALKWDMAERLPDGRILGSVEKMGWIKDGLDHKIAFLAQHVPLHDKTVLELGSYEGDLTVQLSRISKSVTGIEVRPSNIICALTRAFVHDVTNARFVLGDVQELDDSFGTFDVLFHAGLLYHFKDPIKHMYGVSKMSDILLLNTHYYVDDLGFERSDIVHNGKTYKAARYQEFGPEENLSGVDAYSRWLYREDLLDLVRAVGYDRIEIGRDLSTVSGPKITLLAQRSVPLVKPNLAAAGQHTQEGNGQALDATMKLVEQSKQMFEAARKKAEYEEREYRRRTEELRNRLSGLEEENELYKRDNEYYRKYAQELAHTLQGVTNSKIWKWKEMLSNFRSRFV
jgi:ubiquinone/menaquinone biosynthesis C-methylase UbiE